VPEALEGTIICLVPEALEGTIICLVPEALEGTKIAFLVLGRFSSVFSL
jgi:hypothetical protein